MWQTSNPGKEGAEVASQWWLSHGKSECGFLHGIRHRHEGERDDLGKNPSGSLTFKAQNTVTDVAETAVVDHGSHDIDITIKRHLQMTGQPRRPNSDNREKLET